MTTTEVNGPTGTERPGGSAARLRRNWPLLVVAAVLLIGSAYEFLRFQHTLAGHWPAVAVVALLALGLIVGVVVPGLSRVGRPVVGLAMVVGLLFAIAQLRVIDPLVGEWNVTFGAPATVTIARSADGSYTMTAKTPLRVHTSQSCDLAPGTLIANISGTAPSYAGKIGLWNVANCQFVGWNAITFTLGDGTIDLADANGERFVMVRPG